MLKILHLTDPHLVPPGVALHGLDPLARLADVIGVVARAHPDAAFALVSGDLADAGEPLAYAALAKALAGLPMPAEVILGNHDSRAPFRAAFPDCPVDAGGYVQRERLTPAGVFLFLDTLDPGEGAGVYGADRIAWLDAALTRHAGQAAFLVMHHPPFPIGIPGLDAIALADPRPLAACIGRHGSVRHIFFGHVHRGVSGTWRGIGFSSLPATAHQVAPDFHARARLRYRDEPPGYAVVLLDEGRVIVHPENLPG